MKHTAASIDTSFAIVGLLMGVAFLEVIELGAAHLWGLSVCLAV
jgi:hypothetical protein